MLLVLSGLKAGPASAQELEVLPAGATCRAFVLYDCLNDRIVAQEQMTQRQPIASLTKLMTALLVCDRLRFDGRWVLTKSEQRFFGVETMRAQKMLELMLVPSNNTACKTAARLISGDEDAFAAQMNAKAAAMGLSDTRFINPHGLPGSGQYSSAYDVLTLARVALTKPSIRKAIVLHEVELGGKRYESTLKPLYERHPGLKGGKTGWTRAAGRCLLLVYHAFGRDYLLVTLGSKDIPAGYRDAELILSYYGLYSGEVGTWE